MKYLSLFVSLLASTVDAKIPRKECDWACHKDSDCPSGLLCADSHEKELAAAGLDKRKAYCGPVGASNEEVCYDPKKVGKVPNIPVPYKPATPSIGLCKFDCDLDIDCAPGLWCADEHTRELKAAGFDERLANCERKNVPKQYEVCFDPAILKKTGGGFGDPHFRTYDGTMFSYHGQCDIVMARERSFSSGLGMDLHVRTQIVTDWSLISNAALRIGDDVFELANDGSYYFNGAKNVELPVHLAGKYEVIKIVESINNVTSQTHYRVKLSDDEKISMTLFKNLIAVDVDAYLYEAEGLLGIHSKKGLIGRDHEKVLSDPNEFGAEWQVRDHEPMLFHNAELPQYPQQCILPVASATTRKLQEGKRPEAEQACASASAELMDFCVDDVLRTGDVHMALAYSL